MAKKVENGTEDWEKTFLAKVSIDRREREKREEERKKYEKEEAEKPAKMAGELNKLLQKANTTIKHMMAKNQEFDRFLRRLLKGGPINLNKYAISSSLNYFLNLHLVCPMDGISYFGFSYSGFGFSYSGKTEDIKTNFQSEDEYFRCLLSDIHFGKNAFLQMRHILEKLSSPESAIEFFCSHFSYHM